MRQNIKEAWITALRSGEFPFARGQLRTKANSYCVMGVLCEIVRRQIGDGEWVWDDTFNTYGFKWCNKFYIGIAPTELEHYVGLDNLAVDEVYALNDAKTTFSELADFIEAHF